MDLSPQQREELVRLRAQLREQQANIEAMIVREEATELAVSERIGRPAKDGDVITPADDVRASKIVADFWRPVE
jgi:hypothetical protein